ncbi:MAG TPA: helix-turn-helix domain-containing protein [Patescibacteria group bacterium]|nr:helix-turn-helix domain-containing protein [Patescibacteria group bacterium]
MSVTNTLNTLGIQGKEQNVYLALLSLGEARVLDIAKKSGVKRSTIYDILNDLISRGLVTSYTSKKVKIFVAESPQKIKANLEAKLANIDGALPELMSMYNVGETKPVVRMYEGKEGMRQIYENFLETKKKVIYSMGSSKKIIDSLGSIGYSQRRVERKIMSKSLRMWEKETMERDFIADQKTKLREIRLLPKGFNINGSIYIHDNKVSVLSVGSDSFSFVVENQNFADTMLEIFNFIWKQSSPTTPETEVEDIQDTKEQDDEYDA